VVLVEVECLLEVESLVLVDSDKLLCDGCFKVLVMISVEVIGTPVTVTCINRVLVLDIGDGLVP